MLVDDPPQAADQAEAVGVVLVVEDEILGEDVAQHRHLEEVLRQAAQRGAFDQRVGPVQVEAQGAALGQLPRRPGGMEIPAHAGRDGGDQAETQADQQAAAALRSGGGWGNVVLAHGIPSHLNI
ncbi:hypothetical protein D3C76_1504760 [compost metagenome]